MGQFFKNNRYFFIYISILLVAGTGLFLYFDQTEMLLWMNRHRTPLLDNSFMVLTKLGEGIAYFIAAAVFLWLDKKRIIWIGLTGLVVLMTSHSLKIWFGNDRPALFLKKAGLLGKVEFIKGADILWGTTSFPSGHSMSAFALCTLISLWSEEKKIIPLILTLLALATAVSRVYLLAHFQQDVITGGTIGIVIGIAIYAVSIRVHKKTNAVGF